MQTMKKKTCQPSKLFSIYKICLVLTVTLFGFSLHTHAQEKSVARSLDTTLKVSQKKSPTHFEQQQTISAESRDYPIRISKKAGEEQVVHNEDYLRKELERIDLHIKAIDTKVASVNSDPAKRAKAEAEGWFAQMNSTKESLLIERKEILEALKPYQSK